MEFVLIYLVIFYAVFGLASWVIIRAMKKAASKYPPAAPDTAAISGLGGWLLFLVFTLALLGPLATAGQLHVGFGLSEQQDPNLTGAGDWNTRKAATWLSFLLFWAYRVIVVIDLLKGRTPAVVARTKWALWITGPIAALWIGLVVPIMFGGAQPPADTVGVVVASIIWSAIWTAYLSKSKRVAATYGTT